MRSPSTALRSTVAGLLLTGALVGLDAANAGQCTSVHRAAGGWTMIEPPAFPALMGSHTNSLTVSAIVGDDPQTILASDGGAVYRSADGGCSWHTAFVVTEQDYPGSGLGAYAVARILSAHVEVPTAKQTVYLLLSPNEYTVFSGVALVAHALPELVAVSHDGGRNFTLVRPAPSGSAPFVPGCDAAPNAAAVAHDDPDTLYFHCTGAIAQDLVLSAAAGGFPLYRSQDGGKSWSLGVLPNGANFASLTAGLVRHSLWLAGTTPDPSGSGRFFPAAWHSTDDGAHWSLILPGGRTGTGLSTLAEVAVGSRLVHGSEQVVMFNGSGAYDSDDGGVTWTTLRKPTSVNGELPPSAVFLARGAIFVFEAPDACPNPSRLYRYRKPTGRPVPVVLPTRWGIVHTWGNGVYGVNDLGVGARASVAVAASLMCTGKQGLSWPMFLTYRVPER